MQQQPPSKLIAGVAKLEAELFEASLEEETLQRQHCEALEVWELRKSETEALREVSDANVELHQWRGNLEASAQAMWFDAYADRQLETLQDELVEDQDRWQELEIYQREADANHKAWVSATEAALQAEVEASHVANIESLVALDTRLDEDAALQNELKRLVEIRESWERKEAGECQKQADLSAKAAERTDLGNQLQEVYMQRAKEVEHMYALHADTLREQKKLRASLSEAQGNLLSVEMALADTRASEVQEAMQVKLEAEMLQELDKELAQAKSEAEVTGLNFSMDMENYREKRRRYAEAVRKFGRVKEEHRDLLDRITAAREDCALCWRGLDEEGAKHALLAQELDVRKRTRTAEASAAAAAAASEAAQVLKQRVVQARSEHAEAQARCSSLLSDLKEAERGCTVLSHVLQRGLGDQSEETPQDRALREEDSEAVAYFARVQAASAAAGEAAAQSAGAVNAAEEECARLSEQLMQARATYTERSQRLTVAAQTLEKTRIEHRRSESELDDMRQEVWKLECAAPSSKARAGPTAGADSELFRRTETLPREHMLLLQHLRGSQRGGASAGNAGTGALEALRDLREQQLLQASALAAEENLKTAEFQNTLGGTTTAGGDQKLKLALESLGRDREILMAKLEKRQEFWQISERRLRSQIQQLKGGSDNQSPIDADTLARMGVVMREAQKFLVEQHTRVDAAKVERDEVKQRLLDTLSQLEGPEYAELVVSTAVRAAAMEGSPGKAPTQPDSATTAALASSTDRCYARSGRPPWIPPSPIQEETVAAG